MHRLIEIAKNRLESNSINYNTEVYFNINEIPDDLNFKGYNIKAKKCFGYFLCIIYDNNFNKISIHIPSWFFNLLQIKEE